MAGVGEARKDTKQVAKKDIEKSPAKEKKPEKTPALKENRDVKPVNTPVDAKKKGKGKENVEMKNKKNKIADEKPKDFDDGRCYIFPRVFSPINVVKYKISHI